MMNNAGGLRLPPGYRFKPTDEQMIRHLYHKINAGVALLPGIHDVNLYNYSPETLAAMYSPLGDNEWYFFTPMQRKYPNAKKPDRSAGDGFWRAMTAETEVKRDGVTIGRKLALVYHIGSDRGRGVRSIWMMHEFKLEQPLHVKTHANDMTLRDWVMCKVYKNTRKVESNNRARKMQMAGVSAEAGGNGFSNGGADDSMALINHQQQYHQPPQNHNQIVLFDHNNASIQAAATTEFNNGSEYSRAQINPHHPIFDHNAANYEASAAGGGEEFNNGGKGEVFAAGCMMAVEDMEILFNSSDYYNQSLFNDCVNYGAAAAAEGSQEFNNGRPQDWSYVDQCSSRNSSNANVEAQRFNNGKGEEEMKNSTLYHAWRKS